MVFKFIPFLLFTFCIKRIEIRWCSLFIATNRGGGNGKYRRVTNRYTKYLHRWSRFHMKHHCLKKMFVNNFEF